MNVTAVTEPFEAGISVDVNDALHDHDVAECTHFPFESGQARGVNSIIVRQ